MDSSDVKTTPPDVNVGARRPGSLPEAHEGVFRSEDGRDFAGLIPTLLRSTFTRSSRCVRCRSSEVKTQISQTLQRQMFTDKLAAGPGVRHAGVERRLLWTGDACRRFRRRLFVPASSWPRPGAPGAQACRRCLRAGLTAATCVRLRIRHPSNHGCKPKCPGHRRFRKSGNQAASFSVGLSRGGRGHAPTRRFFAGPL